MKVNETCKTTCEQVSYSPRDAHFVNSRIFQGYDLNWLVDGLPAAQLMQDPDTGDAFYSPGFELGRVLNEQPQFHNHYDIIVDYHEYRKDEFRVVGVLVEPHSTQECPANASPIILNEAEGKPDTKVTFTYSVYWIESSTPFATRWDKYLHVYDPKIHWFSLINSAIIVVVLIGMVSTILLRALRKDIARYNRLDQFALEDFGGGDGGEDGIQEDSGWKLVHGDVFRPPKNPLFLSVLIGNGAQVFMMTGVTIGKELHQEFIFRHPLIEL